jgi:GNAT superfamily N-acetyltransferase
VKPKSSSILKILKPEPANLPTIKAILSQWTDPLQVEKYVTRIKNEIKGEAKFNQQFWVGKIAGQVVGVTGLADPLPKVLPLAKTKRPAELKILYISSSHQGQGIGKILVDFIGKEAQSQGYLELMVRSAQRYQESAWGFYEKLGFEKCGQVTSQTSPKLMQVFRKTLR